MFHFTDLELKFTGTEKLVATDPVKPSPGGWDLFSRPIATNMC